MYKSIKVRLEDYKWIRDAAHEKGLKIIDYISSLKKK